MTTRIRRNTKQQPTLRLTRDDGDVSPARVQVASVFSTPRAQRARTRLVAGTVDLPATPDEDSSGWDGVGAVIGRVGPDEFLRGLESTLGRMQAQLDELKQDADDVFKFPTLPTQNDDGPRPRAA